MHHASMWLPSPCQQTLKNLYDKPETEAQPSNWACDLTSTHCHNKVRGWREKKWMGLRKTKWEKNRGRGRVLWDGLALFKLTSPLLPFTLPPSALTLCFALSLSSSCCPQMNSMNSVSSSEDIKPPPGLQNLGNINYQCTSPGGMSKHICSICGDRSSGNVRWWG